MEHVILIVIAERRLYTFEWLISEEDWDEVNLVCRYLICLLLQIMQIMSRQYAEGVTGSATYYHPAGYEGMVWKYTEKQILIENGISYKEITY